MTTGTPWPPKLSAKTTADSIAITLERTNHGASEIRKYVINYKSDLSGPVNWEENSTISTFTLVDLKPNTTYTVWVVAVNDYGRTTSNISVTTSELGKYAMGDS